MTSPFEGFAELDRLIHEPGRLAITTALAACEEADFLFLQNLTGLSKGNLSSHLGKLETAGVVEITKTFRRKRPQTWVRLTPAGRKAVDEHWERLDGLRQRTRRWRPGP